MANACVESIYYSGQGAILLADRDVDGKPTGFVPVGNVSSLTISLERTVFEHKESCSGVRGIDLELVQEFKASISLVMESLNKDNLALALYGEGEDVAAGSVVDEPVTAYLGKWSALENINVTNVAVTNIGGGTTYVEDTDYVLNEAAGSIMALASGAITEGQGLEVSYDYTAAHLVEAMTSSTPPIKWVRFEGLNTARGNHPVVVDCYRWSVGPLAELALINEELSQMTVEGNLLLDTTKSTGSQFFRQRFVTAVAAEDVE